MRYQDDYLGPLLGYGVQATSGARTDADTERLIRQGYAASRTSHHLRRDAVDLIPGDSGMSMSELAAAASLSFGERARVQAKGDHVHVEMPGWGNAPRVENGRVVGWGPEAPEAAPELGDDEFQQQLGTILSDPDLTPELRQEYAAAFAEMGGRQLSPEMLQPQQAPSPSPEQAASAEPAAPSRWGHGQPIDLAYRIPDQQPPAQSIPEGPEGRPISGTDPRHVEQLQARFDAGGSFEELTGLAREFGVNVNPADLRRAIAWRQQNGKGARIVADDVRAAPAPQPDPQAQPQQEASLTAHEPGWAEAIGDKAGDLLNPLLGNYQAQRIGNRVSGLLDWTTVGDVDAFKEFGEREQLAAQEGRYLDQFGNMVGQDVSAISAIPIVGAAKRGAQALGRGGRSIVDRVFGFNKADEAAAATVPPASAGVPSTGARVPDRIDVSGASPLEPRIGRARPMVHGSAEDIAAAASAVRPGDVTPIPANQIDGLEEAVRANPGSVQPLEAPAVASRAPRAPVRFTDHLRARLKAQSQEAGLPVRIDAEDAIDKGVPAELVYKNPGVADKTQLQLRNPGLFGTRYGSMSARQQQLRSLDMDDIDPVQWGFDNKAGGRLDPEDVGDLIRRDLEGDPTARQRGEVFDAWTDHQERAAQKAEFEGRFPDGPPVERLGEPAITPEPPATAYEDLPTLGGKVGNLNLSHIETRGDIRRALQNVEVRFGGFDASRRGKITHAETEALASELRMTAKDLLRRRPGQALNAEQALQARRILAASGDEVVKLAQKAKGGGDADLAEFQKAIVRHAAIQEQVTGATSEAGRALSSFRILARSRDANSRIVDAVVQGGGGRKRLEDVAEAILELQQDPAKLNQFARMAAKPSWRDVPIELFYNSILSAPTTHAINMIGNTVAMAMSVPEYALAAALGQPRRGRALADRVYGAEVGGYVAGLTHGVKNGIRAFTRALRTGEASDAVTKLETRRQNAIPGVTGEIVRIPGRFLTAEDEFFKAVARRGAIGRLAVRNARRDGLKGDDLATRIDQLAANPTDEMMGEAFDFARYMTFQNKPGGWGQGILDTTNKYPELKYAVPFVRTLGNLIKFATARSPLAPMLPEVRKAMRAGGAERDLATARMAIGSAIGWVSMGLAEKGIITGGEPFDTPTRELLREEGWQPYSIRVGDRYISYRRFDPISIPISIASDLATYDKYLTEREREAGAFILAQVLSRNVQDSFWLGSVADLFDMVDKPGDKLPGFFGSTLGSLLVPNIIAQPTASYDPVVRDQRPDRDIKGLERAAQTIINRVKARIPGQRQTLPPRLNPWGEPVRNDGRLGPDFISPLTQRHAKDDPVNQELLRTGLRIGQVGGHVTQDGVRRDLSPAERQEYQRLSGEYIRDDMAEAMAHPNWAGLSEEARREVVDEIKREARADARVDLNLYPERDDDDGLIELPPGIRAPQ